MPGEPDNSRGTRRREVNSSPPSRHREGERLSSGGGRLVVVLVIAHRGLVGPDRPENTLAAVEAAFAADADGVEVDLRLTADGVLVLSHDADLRRLTGIPLPVVSSSWTDLSLAAARTGCNCAASKTSSALLRDEGSSSR
ncbi:glycerophosphodiester phosphodiesterase [Ornithinimicrobium pratense]|uniref:GP-PDE domain-containing protein n=1 Tax=Ornithinimicrobium pratense TaxID=2593973 RepID=A0A5J6V8Z5_9MICO|nr:glycerophosphodiester phosphodiesterase family protein [Ornithinimicrobium pratense]QFG69583.1 hypothetical protein FY030_13510 [Ornithinimicrobium pratense]